ncbi:GAF and ANTAR domain-containing protein [Marmoricola sp. URHB0036]|uniref:GAF and ANTAR domain-containing protein n=1 Tax=Marmoricola sp. URHB0036 TaxID=1298863 RepID=UPI000408900F|nr:GAF and ANTAR domain-containing protein [Marmoricola sp. URHB0036]
MTPDERLVRQAALAERFVALADTLVDDFDVVEVLDGLMGTCLELLGVDEAGLLLTDPRGGLQRVASSSEEARLLELLQVQTREGPCFEAVATGEIIAVDDISATHDRWPAFAERAVADGFSSVYAFPMRLRDATVGGLNLFGVRAASLVDDDQVIAKALADIATIGILQQRSIHRSSVLAENLQRALNTRIVVEQAKGVLSERGQMPMDQTFELLRSFARSHNLKLSELARSIVYPPHRADEVLASRDS